MGDHKHKLDALTPKPTGRGPPRYLLPIRTALAFIVFFALNREVGAARALVCTYVNPAVALAAGVIVLSEPLTPWNLAGLGLILTGSVLATGRTDALPASAIRPRSNAAPARSPR